MQELIEVTRKKRIFSAFFHCKSLELLIKHLLLKIWPRVDDELTRKARNLVTFSV
jgi:hypothetical protein